MPHVDLDVYHVRHPDFYVPPEQPPQEGVSNTVNRICWLLAIVLLPFDVIALAAIYFAVKDH